MYKLMRPLVVIGFLGTTLDAGKFGPTRWSKWRPTVALSSTRICASTASCCCTARRTRRLADYVAADIASVSPETGVDLRRLDFADPWDFEEVYGALLDFARGLSVRPGGRGLPRPHHHRHACRADLPRSC